MAFTWEPLESHRAHTLSTSLWPGIELAAILSCTNREKGDNMVYEIRTRSGLEGGMDSDWTTEHR